MVCEPAAVFQYVKKASENMAASASGGPLKRQKGHPKQLDPHVKAPSTKVSLVSRTLFLLTQTSIYHRSKTRGCLRPKMPTSAVPSSSPPEGLGQAVALWRQLLISMKHRNFSRKEARSHCKYRSTNLCASATCDRCLRRVQNCEPCLRKMHGCSPAGTARPAERP